MDCHHYDAFRCRSCSLLEVPRARQLSDKEAQARSLVDAPVWLPTVTGVDAGFRNKAKMAVGGTVEAPTLGILDRDLAGVDLRGCGLHSPELSTALDRIAAWISSAGLTPYDVAARAGELKHVLLTESPDGELMLRLVVRSTALEARVRSRLPAPGAARVGARAAGGDPQRAARAQGGARGLPRDRAHLVVRAADAAGDGSTFTIAIYAGLLIVLLGVYPVLLRLNGLSVMQFFCRGVARDLAGVRVPLVDRHDARHRVGHRAEPRRAPVVRLLRRRSARPRRWTAARRSTRRSRPSSSRSSRWIFDARPAPRGRRPAAGDRPDPRHGRAAVNVTGQALVPTIVAKREGILDQAAYDAPRGRTAWREEPATETASLHQDPVTTSA